jgi:rubredoxin
MLLLCLTLGLPVIACGSDAPNQRLLELSLKKNLDLPFEYEIDELECEWVEAGKNRFEGVFALTIKTAEAFYAESSLSEALQAHGLTAADLNAFNQALTIAQNLPEPRRASALEKAPKQRPANQQFVRMALKSGASLAGTGYVSAAMENDAWVLTFERIKWKDIERLANLQAGLNPNDKLVEAPETGQYLRSFLLEAKVYGQYVKLAEQQAAKEEAERQARLKKEDEARIARIRQSVSPGQAWSGTFTCPRSSVGEVGVYFTESNGISVAGYVFDPNEPLRRKNFRGALNLERNANGAIQLDVIKGSGVQQYEGMPEFQRNWLAPQGAYKLFFNVGSDNRLLGVSSSKCEMDMAALADFKQKLERAEKEEAERQARIKQSVSPGQAWSGTFTCPGSFVGETGVYFTESSGISVAGYVFDPNEPLRRKDFRGALNLDRGAAWAIHLDMVTASGVQEYEGMSRFQRGWLGAGGSYKLYFNVGPNNSLPGVSSSNCEMKMAAVSDFKQKLDQVEEDRKAKQDQLLAAIEPGLVYKGIWRGSDAQREIAMKITRRSQVTFEAAVYDPAEPNLVWVYDGSLITRPDGEHQLRLIPRKETRNNSDNRKRLSTQWLLDSWSGTHDVWTLQVTDDGLSGSWVSSMWNDKVALGFKRVASPQQ